jgi:chromosome segregation protein
MHESHAHSHETTSSVTEKEYGDLKQSFLRIASQFDRLKGEWRDKASSLKDEIRDRDHKIQSLEQAQQALQGKLESTESDLQGRKDLLAERDEQVSQLKEQLASVRAERDLTAEMLEARDKEKADLEEALSKATSEVERRRNELETNTGHLMAAQSVLSDLKPMLESLESQMNREAREPASALPTDPVLEDTQAFEFDLEEIEHD